MTAPSNAGNAFYASASNESTVRINMPATVNRGQIAWCAITANGNDQEFLFCRGGLLGWTPLIMNVPDISRRYAFLYRWCNGNEGGVQYSTSAGIDSQSRVAEAGVLDNVDISTGPAFSEDSTSSTLANPISPSINFPWGTADSLVQSVIWGSGAAAFSTAPTGYSNQSSHSTGTGTSACAVSDKQCTGASSETPGAYTRISGAAWYAGTIAWKGAVDVEEQKHARPIRTLAMAASAGTNNHTLVIPEGLNRRVLVAIYIQGGVTLPTVVLDPGGANLSLNLISKNGTDASVAWGPGEGVVVWFHLLGSQTPIAGSYTLQITSTLNYEACAIVLENAGQIEFQGVTNRHNNAQTGDHSLSSFGNTLFLTAHGQDTGGSPAAQDVPVTIDGVPPLVIAASHGQTAETTDNLRIHCRAVSIAGNHTFNSIETGIQMMSTIAIGYVPANSANAPFLAAIA